jgi:chromosomal replication initiation ATPase DnaA
MSEVSASYKTSPNVLLLSKRGESHPARHMAIYLSRELSGLTLPEIAGHFKSNSYKTINSGCQRFKAHLAKNSQTKQRYNKIQQRCMQEEI